MGVTSLELSKQIYAAFPEWEDTSSYWTPDTDRQGNRQYVAMSIHYLPQLIKTAPAYDTDYLLDKLPSGLDFQDEPGSLFLSKRSDVWQAAYLAFTAQGEDAYGVLVSEIASTPAEALGLLVLELKKARIEI